jgi:hypothetical protein
VNRLDAIDTTQPCFPRTLWHTARMASTIANLLALTHHVHIRPQLADALRRRGLYTPDTCPCNSPSPQSVTQAFNLSATEATQRWHKIAGLLTHAGRTPYGRRRPSV